MAGTSCVPAGQQYILYDIVKETVVRALIRVEWDGVSVPPNCQGTVFDVHVTNSGQDTWEASFPRAIGGVKRFTITPGMDQTYDRATLGALGVSAVASVSGAELVKIG